MLMRWIKPLSLLAVIGLLTLQAAPRAQAEPESGAPAAPAGAPNLYLPLISRGCASTGQTYSQGNAIQWDTDIPVRPAWNHADKNLALRSYVQRIGGFQTNLVNYTSNPAPDADAPLFSSLFSPARIGLSGRFFQVHNWNWAPSPSPGTRGSPLTTYQITALGLTATPGEVVRAPSRNAAINQGFRSMVIFLDGNSITLKYTREDSAATGYTVHIDGVCPDVSLYALYQQLDQGQSTQTGRHQFIARGSEHYQLPYILNNQPIGQAIGTEIVIAITDVGSFLDPRDCNPAGSWWRDAGSFAVPCPNGP